MAILFSDVERWVRVDLDQTASASIATVDVYRYCREVYHELLHSKSDLQSVVDLTTGAITDLPGELTENDEQYPDALDNRLHAIMAGVRARITKRFLTSDPQIARLKVEYNEFYAEQGVLPR
jgi:hypothetical protein